MTTYEYVAKKDTAETVRGKINAQNEEEAINLINQLGFLPVSVVPEGKEEAAKAKYSSKKIRSKELYVFSRQLANLLKSGVSIIKALGLLSDQTDNAYFRSIIQDLEWNVKNGKSFSECLQAHPTIFSPLYVTLIQAGEESGNIQEMLLAVAEYKKRQDEILSRVRTALAYPILMAVLGAGTVYFVLTFVLPKMSGLFDSIGDKLPWPTQMLLDLSGFLSQYWYLFVVAVIAVALGLRHWRQLQSGHGALSGFLLKLPLFGDVILKTELARFGRTLVLLHRSGVPFLRALEISIPILSNDLIKKDLMICKEDLTSGGSFGQGIQKSGRIPSIMGHLISIGEESGNLDEVLEEIAETYEAESNETIKVMTTLLEPLMILSVGLVVGFIVFAMLLPIFQIDILAQ